MNSLIIMEVAKILIPGAIAFWVGKMQAYKGHDLEVAKDQLYKVYLPMFRVLEPRLYQEIDLQEANTICNALTEIIDRNYEMVDPYLVKAVRRLSNNLSNNSFRLQTYEEICSIVDRRFEILRRKLKLPVRSLLFRVVNRQIPKNLRKTIKDTLGYFFDQTLVVGVLFVFLLAVVRLMEYLKGWIQ